MGPTFQIYFVGNLLVLVLLMKAVTRKLVRTNLSAVWWCSPHLVENFKTRSPTRVNLLARQSIFFLLSFCAWWGLSLSPHSVSVYAAFPLIWFSTEWLGATLGLLTLQRGLPLIHNEPWKALGLMDFWGRRWNIWVNTWLNRVAHQLFPRSHRFRPIGGFLLSALFHELMFALPYQLATGKIVYGLMTSYFTLQAIGTTIERCWLKRASPALLYLWTWAWILLPLPLFTDGPFLALFTGASHE
jgi:hypothetical protein